MTQIDWGIIAVYFLVLIGIVWWSSRRTSTSTDYFLAGRDVGWFAVGASICASHIGSEHVVGLAGSGALNGMAQAHWELHAWIVLLLAWVFVPFYYRAGVFTMPEFLERRFDARSRWVLSIVSLIAYIFTKVSVTVYAGAIVFRIDGGVELIVAADTRRNRVAVAPFGGLIRSTFPVGSRAVLALRRPGGSTPAEGEPPR